MAGADSIKQKAIDLRNRLGGSIFVFAVEPDNPFSEYALAAYIGDDKWTICPFTGAIEDVCGGLMGAMQEFETRGLHIDYNRDVRVVSYPAQMNAPSVTMRRLRNHPEYYTTINGNMR